MDYESILCKPLLRAVPPDLCECDRNLATRRLSLGLSNIGRVGNEEWDHAWNCRLGSSVGYHAGARVIPTSASSFQAVDGWITWYAWCLKEKRFRGEGT